MRGPTPNIHRRAFLAALGGGLSLSAVYSGVALAGQETMTADQQNTTTFTVRIENTTEPDTLQPSDGSSQSVPISPGVFAVFTIPNTVNVKSPFFSSGSPTRDNGLEALAEAGDPSALSKSATNLSHVSTAGVFETTVGNDQSGPADSGDAYEFSFDANPGHQFTFATMFVPSNDLFFAPTRESIPLFYDTDDDPKPISADVTDEVTLWDAGTEKNEEPGVGPNQAPRQSGPKAGQSDGKNTPVRFISGVDDGYSYPDTDDVIRVMIWPENL